ncbi:alcohol dehydrogenase catalytic domain-containing protein [Bernardetia sp. OM2101]|uniref:alcohol dehydrogenase catalytic domain-containing protein n=1 Tax=Bernardetia sp. OM2101 TaxID=3344876 RepID=UPI0035D03D9A
MQNNQLYTTYTDSTHTKLHTQIRTTSIPSLEEGEILVEMCYVPMHGSFWLASHPNLLHPRKEEFLEKDYFVFGNGGIGKVIETNGKQSKVEKGDYVAILGHAPCTHYDCYSCTVLHRYTECDYNESTIIGHGKHSNDGTFAKYAVLPAYSWELCYKHYENPSEEELKAFMFSFLVADVRNAMTRHPDTLRMRRMLLFGAGYSGHLAAYLHQHSCPESKIVVIDTNKKRAASVVALNPDAITSYVISPQTAQLMNQQDCSKEEPLIQNEIQSIRDVARKHFKNRNANFLMDCTSGNSTMLWDNAKLLSPNTHCIPFGFGSKDIVIDKSLIQASGLNILMSRGVGNLRNRRETIELIKAGASKFINSSLIAHSKVLGGLEEAVSFVEAYQNPPLPLDQIPHAYIDFKLNN